MCVWEWNGCSLQLTTFGMSYKNTCNKDQRVCQGFGISVLPSNLTPIFRIGLELAIHVGLEAGKHSLLLLRIMRVVSLALPGVYGRPIVLCGKR